VFIPRKFKQDNQQSLLELIQDYPFATLITQSEIGVEATHLPVFIIEKSGKHYLQAHIAKANPLWKSVDEQRDVLLTFNGPNCYISPNAYPTKQATGKAVPTWNYVVVHVTGKISFIHDKEWIYHAIDTLTTLHESKQTNAWSITDAPDEYIQKMLPAIVGIEIEILAITGQWKLSQNQPDQNQQGVINDLSKNDDANMLEIAAMIKKIRDKTD